MKKTFKNRISILFILLAFVLFIGVIPPATAFATPVAGYVQLVTPNPNIPCTPGWCLMYVRQTFGAPAVEATATAAWNNAQYKHWDTNFPAGCYVPIWFSSSQTSAGHVALLCPDGSVYSSSSPTSTTPTHHASMAALMSYYGGTLTYLGWSEDISTVRVVTGQPVVTDPCIICPNDSGFTRGGDGWYPGTGYGLKGSMIYTYSNGSTASSWGRWTYNLSTIGGPGNYKVEVYIPDHYAGTTNANYNILHSGKSNYHSVNQAAIGNAWVDLGTYDFTSAGVAAVELTDATGETAHAVQIGFDAMRLTYLSPIQYTVTFNSQGGSAVGSVIKDNNSTITAPTSPTRAGYTFVGWYKEAACTNAWNFTTDKVTSSTTLYAKWRAPINSAKSNSYNSMKVFWSAAGATTSYKIYRATSATGTYTLVHTSISTTRSWIDTGRTTGKNYYYKVYPVAGGKTYTFSTYKYAKPIPATPTATLAKYTATSIKVSWSGIAGATKYQIYRATSSTGTYSLVYTASSTARSWVNTGRTLGMTYYYKVRAYHLEGTTKVYGSCSSVKYIKL
jgi:uncharacterized repeat protein (TIGR02543 family)